MIVFSSYSVILSPHDVCWDGDLLGKLLDGIRIMAIFIIHKITHNYKRNDTKHLLATCLTWLTLLQVEVVGLLDPDQSLSEPLMEGVRRGIIEDQLYHFLELLGIPWEDQYPSFLELFKEWSLDSIGEFVGHCKARQVHLKLAYATVL